MQRLSSVMGRPGCCAVVRAVCSCAVWVGAAAATPAGAESAEPDEQAGPSVVRVVETGDAWQLVRNGEPYVIRGAGGHDHLDTLVEAGGNSIRLWGTENAEHHLDEAHARGLTVTVGFWMRHVYRGFDYADDAARAEQLELLRAEVERLKDHPALLIWGVGNEVELRSGDVDLVLSAVEEAAALVKSIDPNHPTMAVTAEIGADKAARVLELCPSIDILGVNTYAGMRTLPRRLLEQGYEGPYIATEFGPQGHWEAPKTAWAAEVEMTSSEKAERLRAMYDVGVGREMPGRALGAYVFRWGHKVECTLTWYGTFLESGERLAVVDVMQELWTGEKPARSAPAVSGIVGVHAGDTLEPEQQVRVRVQCFDPDGDRLNVTWELRREITDPVGGGHPDPVPELIADAVVTNGRLGATLTAPTEPGYYRLYAFVRDGTGRAGTANVPLGVARPERAEPAASE